MQFISGVSHRNDQKPFDCCFSILIGHHASGTQSEARTTIKIKGIVAMITTWFICILRFTVGGFWNKIFKFLLQLINFLALKVFVFPNSWAEKSRTLFSLLK